MSDAKEGIVLDRDGKPIAGTGSGASHGSPEDAIREKIHRKFKTSFGHGAMRFTAASWPGKIILSAIALVMLVVGGAVILLSLFVWFVNLCLRALFGRKR